MPRIVDPQERADEILGAAIKILSEGGFARLTLSNLAKELGGSIRLVTHYFRNREELIHGIVERLTRETDAILDELRSLDDPRERLRRALAWFLLGDLQDTREESVRLALRDHQGDPAVDEFFDVVEPSMRRVLRVALGGDETTEVHESDVDLLRIWTSGIALNAIERPALWTIEHQERALDHLLQVFTSR